jgi:mRNA deadenylase 3'-5' endonuclease subunit Ccr4
MIGIIWNYRGVSKRGMGMKIKDLLSEYSADFIGLQETMKNKYTKFFRKFDPNKAFAWHRLPSNGRAGGSYVD